MGLSNTFATTVGSGMDLHLAALATFSFMFMALDGNYHTGSAYKGGLNFLAFTVYHT